MQHLTSFVLGLLVIVHALGQFTTDAHQGKKGLSVAGKVLTDQKELINHGTSIGSRMIGLGGRRMAAHKALRKLDPVRQAELNGETSSTSSKNSGKESPKASSNSHGTPQNKMKQQGNIKILEPTTLRTASSTSGILKDLKPRHSKDSKIKQPTKAQKTSNYDVDTDEHKLTDETRRLLKATREIVNLMHKDYKGMGRRKPPINNHEPQN